MEGDYIIKMIECSISTVDGKAHCEPLDGSEPYDTDINHPVSMNMYCFKNNFFNYLEEFFQEFRSTFYCVTAVFLVGTIFIFDVHTLLYKFVHLSGAISFA